MIGGTRYQLRLETARQLRLAGEIARSQAEISSGKKILAPSDDPAASARISDIARGQANQKTWRGNLDKALAIYAQADGVLKSLGTTFARAAELMVQGASGTSSVEGREALALEIESLAQHVASLRNSVDSRGDLIFPDGDPIRIPVAADLTLSAVGSRNDLFDAAPSVSLTTILTDAAAALRGGSPDAIATAMTRLNGAVGHIAATHAEHGSRGNRIDDMIEQLQATKVVMEEERKGLESADIAEVVARLQSKELSLEAAQATFARIHRSNLFDLLG